MFELKCLFIFAVCFLLTMVATAVYFYLKLHKKKKYSFKTGIYDGKDIEVDQKISESLKVDRELSEYLKDDMEHHSSKAFKSIEDPDDR